MHTFKSGLDLIRATADEAGITHPADGQDNAAQKIAAFIAEFKGKTVPDDGRSTDPEA